MRSGEGEERLEDGEVVRVAVVVVDDVHCVVKDEGTYLGNEQRDLPR